MAWERPVTAIGVISGTSMDGIDVAAVTTDGRDIVRPGAGRTYPYKASLTDQLLRTIADPHGAEHAPLEALEKAVTDAHVEAVKLFIRDTGLVERDIAMVGMHGQTICHRPERRFTRQLCRGDYAASQLGIAVVNRFRHADLAAGGQGAPLVPLYHRALARGQAEPLVILNLGGVANITYIDGDTVIACDTGPASALIDDFMRRRLNKAFDEHGRLAASGRIDAFILGELMDNPFFALPPPKSLDRQDFHARAKIVEQLSDADGAATLTAFTAEATCAIVDHLPKAPRHWFVTGGGRLNSMMMQLFAERLRVPVNAVETLGWNGDYLEAECFGYLAVRSRKGLPLSLPSTTGVPTPMTGGEYWPAR